MKLLLALSLALQLSGQNYKVQTPSGVVEISPEDYVAGVVAGESGAFQSDEALKAMAIAARTYASRLRGRHSGERFDFCSTTHCQRFVLASKRSTRAAQATVGQILLFNGEPAFTAYSRSCGGRTEDVSAVWPSIVAPYLNSHTDPYCSGNWRWTGSTMVIRDALVHAGLKVPAHLESIAVVQRTSSGRAHLISLNGELLSASSFRFALGRNIGWNTLRSEQYQIESNGDFVSFLGSGEGHGVGLCQRGSDQMGLSGKSAVEILAFYYPGTTLASHSLRWMRLSGEGVALYTQQPDSDRSLIALAEQIIQLWRPRLPWAVPRSIEIYVYPDIDSFRNSTGEPGWVAARTSGQRIELQPVAILRSHNALHSTLEHELIHCFVESAARPGLPVWFREGIVEYLTGHSAQTAIAAPNDSNLRQRQNRQLAQAAYQASQARVATLIGSYGETTVLGWVTRGLPAEVTNSTASKPEVNNR